MKSSDDFHSSFLLWWPQEGSDLSFESNCHLLGKVSPTLQLEELILYLFVVRKNEFLEDDFGMNQCRKLITKNVFL